jgi:hypothetical protein
MNADGIFSVFGSIVTVALVFVIVSNANSANAIRAVGESFATAIKAATGR